MKLRVLKELPGIQVHHAAQVCAASKKLAILVSHDNGANWRKLGKTSTSIARKIANAHSLSVRLVRGGIHAILPAKVEDEAGWIVVAEGKVFQITASGREMQPFYEIPRGRRPLRRGLSVTDDNLFIGEYWSNPERTAVNIHKIHIPTQKAEIFHQFDAGSVRHIHTVDKDPYSGKLWVSTGDEDPECQIVLLDSETSQAQTIGSDSQKWRTVSFAFRPDAVYWGTDNHLGTNQIWRFDRATGQTEAIGDTVGPVYYNASLRDYLVFGTTMEKGEGQQDGYGRLYAIDKQNNIAEVWKRRKDRWHPHWFGYGVFEFAEGGGPNNQFWVTEKGFAPGLRSLLCELSDV